MKRALSSGRSWIACGTIAGILGIGCWSAEGTRAQEAAVVEAETDADGDQLVVPDGDAAELAEFIEKLAQTEAEGETQEEQLAHAEKLLRTIVVAAERMLEAKPDDEQLSHAHQYRLMALQGLSQIGEPADAELYAEAIETLMADAKPELAKIGWQMYLVDRLQAWQTLDEAAKAEVGQRILGGVKDGAPSSLDVSLVAFIAQNLDRVDDAFVATLLTETIPLFNKSKDDSVITVLEETNLEGMLRRLTLLGQPMEISGTLLTGKEVDWKSYRGKVVLVDFWATWCGPCRGEVPNILEMYKGYHDKGFEVLGVSLDATAEDAESYKKDMKLPWDSLFSPDENEREWNHPLARYYGITGIPTAILVDQQGRAVHMEARGPALREQLQALLGDPLEPPADDAEGEASGG